MSKSRTPTERRLIADIEEKLPEVEAALETALGKRIPVLVDYDTFPPGIDALEWLESRGFRTVPDGLQQLSEDQTTKRSLLNQIEAVRLIYNADNCSLERAVSITNKTLTIAFHWDGDLYIDGDLLAHEITKRLGPR